MKDLPQKSKLFYKTIGNKIWSSYKTTKPEKFTGILWGEIIVFGYM